MALRAGLAAILGALLLSACGSSALEPRSEPTSGVVSSPATTSVSPKLAQFEAVPDFSLYGDCGHPCDLGVYPVPNPAPGTPSITKKFPLEASAGTPGDTVVVKCQIDVPEKPVRNQLEASSTLWNGIVIPRERLTDEYAATLPPTQKEVLGYAPDMWLGNKGQRAPVCDQL